MHLTLKLLLWPHISILFDRNYVIMREKNEGQKKKLTCISFKFVEPDRCFYFSSWQLFKG